jgi:hypothetical protein
MMILKLIGITVALVAIAFAAINIKMFVKKGATFNKSCSSVDTGSGEKVGCTCGGDGSDEDCENYEKHHGPKVKIDVKRI